MPEQSKKNNNAITWVTSNWAALGAAILMLAALLFAYRDGLLLMVDWWERMPEYNHGYIIPFVAAYMLLVCAEDFRGIRRERAWSGLIVVGLGLLLLVLGEFSAVYTILQYGFLVALIGLVGWGVGWRATRVIWAPLAYLFFMIPLPYFLYQNLSSELQLISSQFGVGFLRLVGVSVYLEGNVIDLGNFQLQVAEACSGLRYLFPLMSFGFLCAFLFKGKAWQKTVIFLSSIPITVFMNSFRIGAIGVLVEHYGIAMARGFLHDFEGWFIFMACVGILFGEMWLFAVFSRRQLAEIFDVRVPPLSDFAVYLPQGRPSPVYGLLIVVFIGVSFATTTMQDREEIVPEREVLTGFPLRIGDWRGSEQAMERVYLEQLQVDDYLMATFTDVQNSASVELYIAYYESQRKGASVHSPRACLPGGGWEIEEFETVMVPGVGPAGEGMPVNRVMITLGTSRQLVYYWFQQRERYLTNEYMVKWYIFWDALTKNRTDGSLVRLVTMVPETGDVAAADQLVQRFIRDIDPTLSYYLPRELGELGSE
jgi:exosortase D (VPLPA-CTERM-specific)